MPVSASDHRDLLIRTVIGEAGDQSDTGKAAVAHVVMNRMASRKWGSNPSDVVLSRGQFESWQTRARELMGIDQNSPQYQRVAAIVDGVLSGQTPDPTNGATHFLDPKIVRKRRGGSLPDWAQGPGLTIGDHAFYAPKEGAIRAQPRNLQSQRLGFADEDQVPDLLGQWVKHDATNAPANARSPAAGPSPAPAAASSDDILGAWVKADEAAAKGAGANARVADTFGALEPKGQLDQTPGSPGQKREGPETMPQAVNRWMAENQGDTWTERAIRLGAGGLRGVGDIGDTLAQGIGAAGEGGANVLQRLGVISPESAGAVQGWHAGINRDIAADRAQYESAAANSDLATIGRIGGQVVGTAGPLGAAGRGVAGLLRGSPIAGLISRPIIGAAIGGAGAGAGAAALTSAASDEPLSAQVTGGALTGGIVGPASRGVGELGRRVFGGGVDAETAALARSAKDKYGIDIGPGQLSSNPMVRFLDSVLQRFPFTGYGPQRAGQQTAVNRAVAKEMGVTADKITPDVVRTAKRTAYAGYDAAKSAMGPLQVDNQLYQDLIDVAQNATYNLEPKLAQLIKGHLQNVAGKIDHATRTIDPDLYQSLTRKGGPLDKAINSPDSKIASHASEIKDALEQLVGRNSPALKALKDEADYKYFVAKSVEPLAAEATTGDISVAKLLRAVDHSERDIGQIGRIGQRFMKEPPSSGTSERLWLMEHGIPLTAGLAGVGGVGAATYFDPDKWQRNVALGLGGLVGARTIGGMLRGNTLPGSAIANLLVNRGGRQAAPAVNPLQPTISPSIAALLSRVQPAPALPPP